MRRTPSLFLAAAPVACLLVACGDPKVTYVHVPVPTAQQSTHLRGRVIDAISGEGLVGARVTTNGVSTTSGSNGNYVLGGLGVGATELVTSRVGYDTLRAHIPLPGGDYEFTARLKQSATP